MRPWPMATAVVIAIAIAVSAPARADDAKLDKEWIAPPSLAHPPLRIKECCGFPLSEEQGFALRFYWVAFEDHHEPAVDDEPTPVEVYTPEGYFLGAFPARYVRALRMEGSGILADGRVINYAGRCPYGCGTCFEQVDPDVYPVGRGAGRRALEPFRSVAVDPRVIPIGEPLYVPELDGIGLPDGTHHDGCVRADDTGGGIKQRKIDFFVASFPSFRFVLPQLSAIWITPHIETPRCDYLRDSTL